MKKEEWIDFKEKHPEPFVLIEAEVKHCNSKLGLKNEIITGMLKDDGFYFEDDSELSFNWDIVKWRREVKE